MQKFKDVHEIHDHIVAVRRHDPGLIARATIYTDGSCDPNPGPGGFGFILNVPGAELIEHGDDFQEAREHAGALAAERGAHMVPSFHADLLSGVATYWWEFLRAVPRLDVVYVPIGLGSGACSAIAAKLALGREVRIVGVVSSLATTYADSLAAGRVVASPVSTEIADGMAVRVADQEALDILIPHLDHIVQVTDAEVAGAMRILFTDTHNVAEGAGAAALAAALQERETLRGRTVGLTLTGGNVDADVFARVLHAG